MPIAAVLARAVHQPVDLALGEVAPLNCQVYDAWDAFLGCRFHAGKPCLRVSYCIGYTRFLHSRKGRSGCMERIAIAMQDGGTGAGAQHGDAGREANLILSCRRTSIWDPRGGGTFWFQILLLCQHRVRHERQMAPPMLLWPKPLDLRLERGFDRPVRRLNGDHARPGIGDTASLADAIDLRTLLREFASAQD